MRPGVVGGGLGGILVLLVALFFGLDPSSFVNSGGDAAVDAEGPANTSPADDATKDFVASVLGYTEDTWSDLFRREGRTYREPKLVLFTGAVDSACGMGHLPWCGFRMQYIRCRESLISLHDVTDRILYRAGIEWHVRHEGLMRSLGAV